MRDVTLSPAPRALVFSIRDPGVPLRFTPGFMLSPAPQAEFVWQIVPTVMIEMLQDKDAQKAQRVMAAMLQMKKIDIATLKRAYEGE